MQLGKLDCPHLHQYVGYKTGGIAAQLHQAVTLNLQNRPLVAGRALPSFLQWVLGRGGLAALDIPHRDLRVWLLGLEAMPLKPPSLRGHDLVLFLPSFGLIEG
jgi:hypothetical protein